MVNKWLIEEGQSTTIEVDDVRHLIVTLVGGQVDVLGHDDPTTRVEVRGVKGKELKITLDGDRLEIDHPQVRWDNFIEAFRRWHGRARAEVSILVPRDVELRLGTVTAPALASGLSADAKLNTVSGDITVEGCVGALDLHAVSGELSALDHSGRVTARTVAGDITATGAITRFASDGVGGNVFLDLTEGPDTVDTKTVSGDLTLRLERGLGARYRINTVSGTLRIDDSTYRATGGRTYRHDDGPLDGGAYVEVSAKSVSGDISVLRHDAATHPGDGAEPDTAKTPHAGEA